MMKYQNITLGILLLASAAVTSVLANEASLVSSQGSSQEDTKVLQVTRETPEQLIISMNEQAPTN